MIVELCGLDLLKLSNGEQIAIGDLIVRSTTEDHSTVIGSPVLTGKTAEVKTNRSRATRTGPAKTGQRVMESIFERGHCYQCRKPTTKGDQIVYDYDNRKAYCLEDGLAKFPHLNTAGVNA